MWGFGWEEGIGVMPEGGGVCTGGWWERGRDDIGDKPMSGGEASGKKSQGLEGHFPSPG